MDQNLKKKTLLGNNICQKMTGNWWWKRPEWRSWPGPWAASSPPALSHVSLSQRWPVHTYTVHRQRRWELIDSFLGTLIPCQLAQIFFAVPQRLNMELDLQSLFELHVTWCAQLYSTGWDPATPPIPTHWDSYTKALLVSKDRRHLFATPCCTYSKME